MMVVYYYQSKSRCSVRREKLHHCHYLIGRYYRTTTVLLSLLLWCFVSSFRMLLVLHGSGGGGVEAFSSSLPQHAAIVSRRHHSSQQQQQQQQQQHVFFAFPKRAHCNDDVDVDDDVVNCTKTATTSSTRLQLTAAVAADFFPLNRTTTTTTSLSLSIPQQQAEEEEEEEETDILSQSSSALSSSVAADSITSTSADKTDSDGGAAGGGSSSTVAQTTLAVVKAMVGSGVLALPAGLAAVSNHPASLWPAHRLMLAVSLLSGYTFSLYGRLVHRVQQQSSAAAAAAANDDGSSSAGDAASTKRMSSLGDLWKHIRQTNASWPISVANLIYCSGCALMFLLVLGDTLSHLLHGVLVAASSGSGSGSDIVASLANSWLISRQACILATAGAILFPLCNLSSLAALAPISAVGVAGSLLSTLFVVLRCPAVVKSSPYALPAGRLLPALAERSGGGGGLPQFATYAKSWTTSPAPLILLSMACVALMAHFSALDFYNALTPATAATTDTTTATSGNDEKSPNNKGNNMDKTLFKYHLVTAASFLTTACVNGITLTAGFLTFGGQCAGTMLLNNYATADVGAAVSRAFVATSVAGGFPLLFQSARASALDLFANKKKKKTSNDHRDDTSDNVSSPNLVRQYTWRMLAALTAVSMVVKDAGFVVSFNGAVMGSAITFIFPALLFLHATKRPAAVDGVALAKMPLMQIVERWFCRFLVVFGGLAAAVGGTTSVLHAYFPHVLQ